MLTKSSRRPTAGFPGTTATPSPCSAPLAEPRRTMPPRTRPQQNCRRAERTRQIAPLADPLAELADLPVGTIVAYCFALRSGVVLAVGCHSHIEPGPVPAVLCSPDRSGLENLLATRLIGDSGNSIGGTNPNAHERELTLPSRRPYHKRGKPLSALKVRATVGLRSGERS
jgi:hypothetical protein